MKSVNDELIEQTEGIRRENKNLTQEIKDLSDQLTEGGRSVHELQKMVRRLELEKEELQVNLLWCDGGYGLLLLYHFCHYRQPWMKLNLHWKPRKEKCSDHSWR